jgi:hypothetical protein
MIIILYAVYHPEYFRTQFINWTCFCDQMQGNANKSLRGWGKKSRKAASKITVMSIITSHCQKQLDLSNFLTCVIAINCSSRTLCWIKSCTFLYRYPSQVFLNDSQKLTSVWFSSSISGWFTESVHWLQLHWRCWTSILPYIPPVL